LILWTHNANNLSGCRTLRGFQWRQGLGKTMLKGTTFANRVSTAKSRRPVAPRRIAAVSRRRALRKMLIQLREEEMRNLNQLVRSERGREASAPGDESDNARLHEDLELQVSLVRLSESRLTAICDALDRLEQGRYGICEQCGDGIPFGRLRAIPMASFCVDCQQMLEAGSPREVIRGSSAVLGMALFDAYPGSSLRAEASRTDDAVTRQRFGKNRRRL
jgi:RNA polymerase-binding transcription factor